MIVRIMADLARTLLNLAALAAALAILFLGGLIMRVTRWGR